MSSVEYLTKVLSNWSEFLRTHRNIEKAIKDVLEENKRLKEASKKSTNKLTNVELADLFSYCARLSRMVAPSDARRYYDFTFDSSVSDTLDGLAMLYAGSSGASTSSIESFRQDELYGPTLKQMFDDIDRLL